jgi:diacylglycerol O-acyltransferase
MARAMEWPDSVVAEGETPRAASPPSTIDLIRTAGKDHIAQLKKLPTAIRDTATGVYRLQRRSRQRRHHPDLANRFKPPPTFLNHKLSSTRTFASATLSLAEVKATSKRLGVTINDLVLATTAPRL